MTATAIEWGTRTLGSLGKWLSGGTPSRSNPEYWGGDIPWISAKSLTSFRVSESDRYVTEAGLHNGTRSVPPGTLLFLVRGMSLKSEFRMGITTARVAFNQDVKAIVPNPDVDARFLAYALQAATPRVLAMVGSAAHGTGRLPTDLMRDLEIAVPRKDIQEAVAAILSAYDDLIENNNRRMELLEEAVRLLYREWFVHLRFPGHERVEVVDGVPEGWRRGVASELVEVLSGGTPRTSVEHYWNGPIPFFTPKDAPAGVFVWETEKSLTEEGVANCSSREFPKGTIFITARGTVGKLAVAQRPMAVNQSCYALAPRPPFGIPFAFAAMAHMVSYLQQAATGGVFDTIIKKTFDRTPVFLPAENLVASFSDVARPMLRQVETLSTMNRKLRKARDLLLPRLMDGRIPL